ncbi:DKNYY domain-containing protein [Maribacter forsetii]|uniref:DKNYY domain-containing protein n=1 Tax=Maribacter forsetii TaxID=444515 RepID=UPI00055CB8F7|nr:DKNYY domain-containing protein [Maribacter forsetii]
MPQETICYNFEQAIELGFITEKSEIRLFEFKLSIGIFEISETFCEKFEIDFNEYSRLIAINDEPSNYYKSDDVIFYYSPYSRAFEEATVILKGKQSDYKILNEYYAINDQKVYYNGRLVRGFSSKGFKIFNRLFAGNNNKILTRYGNAKIENPKAFKVIDNGLMPSLFTYELGGYRCGYAVDNQFAYYFDESNSTQHAIKVKACKNPKSLKSLSFGYAKDDTNVYLEGKKITKAKPETFEITNRNYSTDGKKIFFHRDAIESIDLKSFEILPTISHQNSPDKILNSLWAKDKNNYFKYGYLKTKEKYEKHLKSYKTE